MKNKLLAVVIVMAMAMTGCVVHSGYYSGVSYGYGGYDYYDLPSGYHYEYRSAGPVIVSALTGAVITYAALRAMYPHHHWRRLDHEPHFVRDYRPAPPPRPHYVAPAPRPNPVRPPAVHHNSGPRPNFGHRQERPSNSGHFGGRPNHQRPPQQMRRSDGGSRPQMHRQHDGQRMQGGGHQGRPHRGGRPDGQRERR